MDVSPEARRQRIDEIWKIEQFLTALFQLIVILGFFAWAIWTAEHEHQFTNALLILILANLYSLDNTLRRKLRGA